jgi:hypothetical protein
MDIVGLIDVEFAAAVNGYGTCRSKRIRPRRAERKDSAADR